MTEALEIHADAVIFDMDGTLVDSIALVERVWATFAERHGIDLPELLAFAHGRRADDTLAHFLGSAAAASAGADLLAARAAVQEHELGVEGAVLEIPGAAPFVASFDPADVALVTSAPRELAGCGWPRQASRCPRSW
ncbi:HAD family hydrolase [Herbiconiux sp. UC225_62]|uniref:HAD family hydrolase n=1 Tax=Herbiconiux sp. UC225_62 TaxID=3350168 RepID=UPI0036D3339E